MTAKSNFLAGVFLISLCGLMLQIVETRILSVIFYYYLAFFAISMAMFGMTAGSLFIYFREDLFPKERLAARLAWICAAFALAVTVSDLLTISTVLRGQSDATEFVMGILQWCELIVILAAPYVFAGMAVALALTRSPWPVPLVYGVDLIGAASGCLAVLAVLTVMDAVSALFLVAALGALAGWFFARAGRGAAPSLVPKPAVERIGLLTRPAGLAVALAVLAIANAAIQPYGFKLSMVKGEIETLARDEIVRWNSFSRVRLEPNHAIRPLMWGPSPVMPAHTTELRRMTIDGSASSALFRFDGDVSKLEFLKYDITNIAYAIRHGGRAAVIGVGGGRDMLAAKFFGFAEVTGIELNPILVEMLTRDLRSYDRLADLPGVRLVADEGRSWFARTAEHFDLIQMSMVDTWAATGAGAFSLSENGLYTVEGWRTFLDRLTPTGVLTVSRWYAPQNSGEIGRVISIALAALADAGVVEPRDHVFVATADELATLVVSRAALSAEDLTGLEAAAAALHFSVLVRPGAPVAAPIVADVLAARGPADLERLSAVHHLDLTAPTDDRPFFFLQLRLTDPTALWFAASSPDGVVSGNLRAASTLFGIILLSLLFAAMTILVPSLPSVRQVEARLAWFGSAYFLLIGLGFMFVEIGLIERISIYLGHPAYGLAIGLFGIIVSTGAGSLLALRLSLLHGARLIVWTGLLGLYLILLPLWFPLLVEAFAAAALPVRVAVSLLAIVPSGLLMGFGFPTGMEIVNRIDPRPTPWFWAVNGAASVLAAGLAIAISIAFSISVCLWCGAAAYLALGPVAAIMAGQARARARAAALEAEPTR